MEIGAVDEAVDAPAKFGGGAFGQRLALGFIADVAGDGDGLAALCLDVAAHFIEEGLVTGGEYDARAFGCGYPGQRLTHAGANATDDHDLVLEQHPLSFPNPCTAYPSCGEQLWRAG